MQGPLDPPTSASTVGLLDDAKSGQKRSGDGDGSQQVPRAEQQRHHTHHGVLELKSHSGGWTYVRCSLHEATVEILRLPEMETMGTIPLGLVAGLRVLRATLEEEEEEEDPASRKDENSKDSEVVIVGEDGAEDDAPDASHTLFCVHYRMGAVHVFRTTDAAVASMWVDAITRNKVLLEPKWLEGLSSIFEAPVVAVADSKHSSSVDRKPGLDAKNDNNDDCLDRLLDVGFEFEEAQWAFRLSKGDIDRAVTILCHSKDQGRPKLQERRSTARQKKKNPDETAERRSADERKTPTSHPQARDQGHKRAVFTFHGALTAVDTEQRTRIRRWYALENCRLFWSERGSLVINGALTLSPSVEIEEGTHCEFYIHLSAETIQLEASSAGDVSGWVMALQRGRQMQPWSPTKHTTLPPAPPREQLLINDSDQGILKMRAVAQRMFRRMAHDRVKLLGRPGDILLFRTKGSFLGGLTRAVTASEWDHIGLLVGTGDRLEVMEALMAGGVQTSRYSQFYNCCWYKQYSSVALRRLVGPRRRVDIEKRLEGFTKKVVGKKYQVKAMKILSSWMGSTSATVNELDKKAYCCSEIVAAAYKELGILRPDVDAVAYVPGDFASEKTLFLLEGFRLENEIQVLFRDFESLGC
mmetsp:Transcript_8213/g.20163  ORF Transcript_8213/g.20163 Transcript_8213/m.20163 type:complete len:640 (+) Transcript_8213:15-1934(+)